MFSAISAIAIATACAFAASYVIWRAASRSGLWALIAGVVLVFVAFGCAVLIGWAITRAWLPH
jgi:hypothetical protein